jgi:putative aldouronate transport system permease protein
MRMRRRRISAGQALFVTLNALFLSFVILVCFYPFFYIIISSLNDPLDLLRGPIYFWPRKFSVLNFQYVLKDPEIVRAIWVTVARTVVGTVVGVLFTAAFAYGISKKRLWGRRVIMGMTLVTIYFSGGLIPTYLLIAQGLRLHGNFLAFIFPNMFNAFFAFIMMSFFREISPEIEESAHIDGATEIRVFVQLILPISTAVLATIALFFGVWHWNSWFDAMLYGGRKLMTLQQYLVKAIQSVNVSVLSANYRSQSVSSQSLRLATMVLTTFPIVVIYPFLQRYFVKGVMIGSLKG